MNTRAIQPTIYQAHALLLLVSGAAAPPAVALGCDVAAEQIEETTGPALPAELDPDVEPAAVIRPALRWLAEMSGDVFGAGPIRRSIDEATRAYLQQSITQGPAARCSAANAEFP